MGGTTSIKQGKYYETQIGNKSRVIAWSHRSRFETAVGLINRPDCRVLDYGCGDGTFLAIAADRIGAGHGVDVNAGQVEDCRSRLAELENLTFSLAADLAGDEHNGTFDVVTCMETLEHVPEPVVDTVLADVTRLCADDGQVIISVPVEIGPSFLVKQTLRAVAKRTGAVSYHINETYGAREAAKMLFAGRNTKVQRRLLEVDGDQFYTHFGFNWRYMRGWVSQYLDVKRTFFTPVNLPGGMLSSQAYFVCQPRR